MVEASSTIELKVVDVVVTSSVIELAMVVLEASSSGSALPDGSSSRELNPNEKPLTAFSQTANKSTRHKTVFKDRTLMLRQA